MSLLEQERFRSEKIQSEHYERLAVVYIRQSTMHQVLHHQESTRLQYGLQARARNLGWPEDRILVIDDDLGCSGSSAVGRTGFQRLVAEVSLDHVGIILGAEMSRLARSGKDWHHLLEICALFGTLLADLDGIYTPGDYNDRLLLGLKGTMSEAELHILKQRMYQGKLQKARRGELGMLLPIGYMRRPSGEVQFDPDEQVQQVVRLVFRKFEELGTLNAVLRYLVHHGVQLGVRVKVGPAKGELEWHRPNRVTLQNMLKNPAYAGAYAYGRRAVDARRKKPGRPSTGRTVQTVQTCAVLLKERLPAYISWQQYERNLAQLAANQARGLSRGAIRRGPALLTGLLVCGKCGCRLSVSYRGQAIRHAYICGRRMSDYGEALCQHMAGPPLDEVVSSQVLAALAPAALEFSLAAAEHLERERAELADLWAKRLERAGYEVERAKRQYQAVEPEHRLVARQLEREWEAKLAAQRALEEELHRFEQAQPRVLTADERAAIRQLATDIPVLWRAATTTDADRKAILRQLLERVVVTGQGDSEHVHLRLEWAGGMHSELWTVRPVAKLTQLSYYPRLCQRVRELVAKGLSPTAIAEKVNREGFRPPKRQERFGKQGIQSLMHRLGLVPERRHHVNHAPLAKGEWLLPDLARHLEMPAITLYSWVRRGWVRVRYIPGTSRRLVVRADKAEVAALRERRNRPPGWYTRRNFLEEAAADLRMLSEGKGE